MQRRDFFNKMFAFVPLGLGFLGISKLGLDFLTFRRKPSVRKVFAASLLDLPVNASKKMTDLKGRGFTLLRTGPKEVKALSTVCTHLGCAVHWEAEKNIFFCPCHNGVFDADGNVKDGPPPRKLDSYKTDIEGSSVYIYMEDKED